MEHPELIRHARRLLELIEQHYGAGTLGATLEFLRTYSGQKSGFYQVLNRIVQRVNLPQAREHANHVLMGFIDYIEGGLETGDSPGQPIPLTAIQAILDRAQRLVRSPQVPAWAVVILAGGALGAFFEIWVRSANLKLGRRTPSIEYCAKLLVEADRLPAQDALELKKWDDLQQQALMEKDTVIEPDQARKMLQWIQLFIKKYEGQPLAPTAGQAG